MNEPNEMELAACACRCESRPSSQPSSSNQRYEVHSEFVKFIVSAVKFNDDVVKFHADVVKSTRKLSMSPRRREVHILAGPQIRKP